MFKSQIESTLDAEILSALKELDGQEKTSEKYGTIVERISKLHKLKSEENRGFRPLSLDTVLVVGANIFGILWLARYERENVIRSPSAMKFVMRP